jgi:hypothetical protein
MNLASNPPAPTSRPADPRDDAFIREVDEAYREDELKKFARDYGRWILLAVAVGLAALGGWLWWQAEQVRRTEALSEKFSQALDKVESGATTEAVPMLEEIGKSGNPSYRALAAFAEAGIALNGGDSDKAAAAFRRVIADPKAAQPLRDAATLKLVRLEFDKLKPDDVLKQTAPFLAGDNPWFPVAGELAALAHLKAGDTARAGAIFYRLAADPRTPQSLRARAEQMAAALGQDVTKIAEAQAKAREAESKAAAADAGKPARAAAK